MIDLDQKIDEASTANFAETAYRNGYFAWQEGRTQSARNHWRRFMEAKKREEGYKPDSRMIEVRGLLEKTRSNITPQAISAAPRKKRKPRRKRRVKKTNFQQRDPLNEITPRKDQRLAARQFVERGRRAHQNGQLDEAYRLYNVAQQLDPESGEIRRQLESVGKEISGN